MERQRFRWFRVRENIFSLMDYYEEKPPYVSLECGGCSWRQAYPDLSHCNYVFDDARRHECSCPTRAPGQSGFVRGGDFILGEKP